MTRIIRHLAFFAALGLGVAVEAANEKPLPCPQRVVGQKTMGVIRMADIGITQFGSRKSSEEMKSLRHALAQSEFLPEPLMLNRFPEDGSLVIFNGHHRFEAALANGKTTLDPREYELTHYTYEEALEINFQNRWYTPFDPRTHFRLAQTAGFKRLIGAMLNAGVPKKDIEKFIRAHPEAYSIAKSETAPTPGQSQAFEGGFRDKEAYLTRMDASMPVKIGQLLPGIPRSGIIYEPGAGSGNQSAAYAAYYPQLLVVASDLDLDKVRHAQAHFPFENLVFFKADGLDKVFPDGFLDGKLDSSFQHHPFTYSPPFFSTEPVERYRRLTMQELKEGRYHSFRDFVFAEWPDRVEIEISSAPAELLKHAPFGMRTYPELLLDYGKRYRAIRPDQPSEVIEVPSSRAGFARFRVPKELAHNFLWRMGYTSEDSITNEGRELYGYYDQSGHIAASEREGGQVVFAEEQNNPYLDQNWWQPAGVQIFDESGGELPLPSTNYIQFTRKPAPHDPVRLSFRETGNREGSWLEHVSYRHNPTGKVYDLVRIPGIKRNFVPFEKSGETVLLYLNPSVERPSLLVYARESALNRAHYFGIIPEVLGRLAVDADDDRTEFEKVLKAKATTELPPEVAQKVVFAAPSGFLSNPVGTNEWVQQVPVDMRGTAAGAFAATENLQSFELNQLLSANHAGAIPNPLVELAAYRIGYENGAHFTKWFGSNIDLRNQSGKGFDFISNYLPVLTPGASPRFERAPHANLFMRVLQGEMVREFKGRTETARWDIALPAQLSCDIFSVLPYTVVGGEAQVGLEPREFAALHDRGKGPSALVVPTWRLEKTVRNSVEARASLLRKLAKDFDLVASQVFTLGNGYFPALGSTAERVTPFAVKVDAAHPPKGLVFVPLRALLADIEQIPDLNTRLSVYRLAHALSLLNR